MKIRKFVAAVASASLSFGTVGSYAQSYIAKDQQDQAAQVQAAREYAAQQPAARGSDRHGSGRPENPAVRADGQHGVARGNNGSRADDNRSRSGNGGYARDERGAYSRNDRADQRPYGWNDRADQRPYGWNDRAGQRPYGWNGRGEWRGDGANNPQYRHEGRGAGRDHAFYRGDRLPAQYRSRQYVVDDWRGHHLRQPPRGYHWVQTGSDYVLAAIATGLIAAILLNQ